MSWDSATVRGPRVAILGLGWFPDQTGGLNRYVRDLVLGLGADVAAVVVGPAVGAPACVIPVSHHDARLPGRLLAYARAARRAAHDADVVDAHFALHAAAALLVPSVRRRPLIVHFHGPWADEARRQRGGRGGAARVGYRARRAVERWVYRRADRVVVLSDAFADLVAEIAGIPRDRVIVVPPAVDGERFRPGDRRAARAALGLPDEAWVAASARRLVPRTGVDTLLAAWIRVSDAFASTDQPVIRLLIAGEGPCRAELEAAARPARDTIRFLGPVPDEQLVALYRAADVSVVPSNDLEGFGLVVAESLACGTPVVVTDVGGLPGAVAGLGGGGDDLVVPPGDAAALAERLLGALDGRRPLPDRDACHRFAGRFAMGRMLDDHRRLYSEVAARGRAAAAGWRPRILFLDHTARLSGGELALARLVEALSHAPGDRGADVTVLCFEDGPLARRLRSLGVETSVLALASAARDLDRTRVRAGAIPLGVVAATVVHTLRLGRWIRRRRPDVVVANSLKAGVVGGVAARLAGVPFVWHLRDRVAGDYLPVPAARALRWWIPRISSGIVANSRTTLRTLAPARTPAVVVPDPYRPPAPRAREPRSRDDVLRVGMVGRIAPWKGQHVFLDAFARAFPDENHRAVVAGAPLFGEEEYEESLRARVRELGIADRVDFVGFVDDVPALLADLDVLVHASVLPEPHGQVVVEGMAAGLAVIAADAGGPSEIITTGIDGVLVAPGDAGALAATLRRVGADPDLRARLGVAATERAADFDPDRIVPLVLDEYRSVARRRPPAPPGRPRAAPESGPPA